MNVSRRRFLQSSCAAVSVAPLLNTILDLRLLSSLAEAQQGDDYKALVCVFLYGGNDGSNTIIPLNPERYNEYRNMRGGLALPSGTLLPLIHKAKDGVEYGLHGSMKEVQEVINRGKGACLFNVGPLYAPTTREDFVRRASHLPPQLFSHSDQTLQWQSCMGSDSRTGWAGRIADVLNGMNGEDSLSMCISVAGMNVLEIGRRVVALQVDPYSGGIKLKGFDGSKEGLARHNAFTQMLQVQQENIFEDAYAKVMRRAVENEELLGKALDATPPLSTPFPDNYFGTQFKMIARLIAARSHLKLNRQIFFCGIHGYDTHDGQLGAHSKLLSELSQCLAALYKATEELGVSSKVTTFTASDFGRTMTMNNGGSDHGWGNHHFILGGAIKGGLYGEYPTLTFKGPEDSDQGRWIPTVAVDQYAATLAQWFGVSAGALRDILPNLSRFNSSNLGFLP